MSRAIRHHVLTPQPNTDRSLSTSGLPCPALLPGGIIGKRPLPSLPLLVGRHFSGNFGFMFRVLDPVLMQGVAQPIEGLFPVAFGAFRQRDDVAFPIGLKARRRVGPGRHLLGVFGGMFWAGHDCSSSEEERAGLQKVPGA
jgi:hypothetical protein